MAEEKTPFFTPSDEEATRAAPADLSDGWGDAPSQIGPYRLVRRIGEGGMGQVWEAEQKEPIERTVALKLVKLGMDTKQFVARFESERQALALMEHPSIARVIDGGATETGRPYFVMEYVQGVPITQYCDDRRLTIRERLELFQQVCAGVQHAHQKGIIHRDLKPSNVMVTEVDGKPSPKIIDFGVAKATTQSLTDKTVQTMLGGWIGTPAYMSPEQAEITDDIDTRTDVYSLGVMLYELLTGLRPFDLETLDSVGFDEIRRVIREVDAPRPSTRASASSASIATAAEARQTEPRVLVKRLKGDLDWIVMKAVEKEKERRYGSPSDLAADIERHLTSQPVLASPPSRVYRARKFVRRHRIGVAAGMAVTVSLVAAVAGTGLGLVRATAEAERANQEAETARQVTNFLVGLFEASDPFAESQGDLTVRELLDRSTDQIERGLANEPRLRARLLATIGQVHSQLGLFDAARTFLDDALTTQQSILDADDPQILTTQIRRAWLASRTGNYELAQSIYDAILPALDEGQLYSDVFEATEEWVAAINDLGVLQWSQGDLKNAKWTLAQALTMGEEIFGVDAIEVATTLNNLGLAFANSMEHANARPFYERALSIQENIQGPDHPGLSTIIMNLASTVRSLGDFESAHALLERGLRIAEASLEPDHPQFAGLNNGLGIVLWKQHDYEGALERLEHAGKLFVAAYGETGHGVGKNLRHQARVFHSKGDLERSKLLYERSVEIRGGYFPGMAGELAEVLEELGDIDGALEHHRIEIKVGSEQLDSTNAYFLRNKKLYEEFLQRNGLDP